MKRKLRKSRSIESPISSSSKRSNRSKPRKSRKSSISSSSKSSSLSYKHRHKLTLKKPKIAQKPPPRRSSDPILPGQLVRRPSLQELPPRCISPETIEPIESIKILKMDELAVPSVQIHDIDYTQKVQDQMNLYSRSMSAGNGNDGKPDINGNDGAQVAEESKSVNLSINFIPNSIRKHSHHLTPYYSLKLHRPDVAQLYIE